MSIKKNDEIKLPINFKIYDIKDAYFWYVVNFGISEDLFWKADIAFVEGVIENKIVYDKWLSYQIEKRK